LSIHDCAPTRRSAVADLTQDLRELYRDHATGAVTTRTSLLDGFAHDPEVNQYIYFDVRSNTLKDKRSPNSNSTLNTLGYSPIPLPEYLQIIERIVTSVKRGAKKKPFVVSVTGSADEVVRCHGLISDCSHRIDHPLLMEINLSCPNIPRKPPPAYSSNSLQEYLTALQRSKVLDTSTSTTLIGIKTPPYTYFDQYQTLIDALLSTTGADRTCPVDFITATNTLGGCLVLAESNEVLAPSSEPGSYVPAVASASGTGLGGVGGAVIHALALGNVRTIRSMLDQHHELQHIEIIGVGGVSDYAGYARFRSIGAAAVGIGTALGKEGIMVFQKILNELETLSMFAKLGINEGRNDTGPTEKQQKSLDVIEEKQDDVEEYDRAQDSGIE